MEKNIKSKNKVFFLTFYNAYPITSGASNISTNFIIFALLKKIVFN